MVFAHCSTMLGCTWTSVSCPQKCRGRRIPCPLVSAPMHSVTSVFRKLQIDCKRYKVWQIPKRRCCITLNYARQFISLFIYGLQPRVTKYLKRGPTFTAFLWMKKASTSHLIKAFVQFWWCRLVDVSKHSTRSQQLLTARTALQTCNAHPSVNSTHTQLWAGHPAAVVSPIGRPSMRSYPPHSCCKTQSKVRRLATANHTSPAARHWSRAHAYSSKQNTGRWLVNLRKTVIFIAEMAVKESRNDHKCV